MNPTMPPETHPMERAGGMGLRNTPVTVIGYDVHWEWEALILAPVGRLGDLVSSASTYLPGRSSCSQISTSLLVLKCPCVLLAFFDCIHSYSLR